MVVLPFTGASRYHNYCIDGGTSPEYFGYTLVYVMDGGNDQRVAIKFCFKDCLSATETLVLVEKGYVNEALYRSNFLKWYIPI
jgi:hypothetical protein